MTSALRGLIVATLIGIAAVPFAGAQILPGRSPIRAPQGLQQPARRDTMPDTTAIKWPTPDSIAQRLLNKRDYTITKYQGDTAFFNAERKSLDLLAAGKKRRAIVDRDSQIVVSDSGIYYSEATRHVTTGGQYIMRPGGGQADIKGHGRGEYNLAERSATVTNARFPVNNGEMWYLDVNVAKVIIDSTSAKNSTLYARGGSITSCDDSIPDYHFEYKMAKRTGDNTIVASPAVLYIKDIPVLWMPFIFSDTRAGRHSGILPPQFGVGDIVRNSPTYRRNVDHVGYYWALSDYMDFATWIDWRSSAGAQQGDPGWIRYNGDFDYKWLNRFLGGRVGLSYTQQNDSSHQTNFAASWAHNQDFSHDAHLNTNLNYVTSTALQRQNTFNPIAAIATIASAATFNNRYGPASITVGATRKQYPGRTQVDQTVPSFNITTTPISAGTWLSWTPAFSFTRSDVFDIDQPGPGSVFFQTNPVNLRPDSVPLKGRNSSTSLMSFDTPLQIFGRDFRNSFRVAQQRNDYPQLVIVNDVHTGEVIENRVYAATYRTDVDWTPEFALPALARNKFNLTPSVSLSNVDPGPFWVATQFTNGQYVHQSKRLTYGLSASPTIFGLFPGWGPFARFRHSITPQIGYSYAPASRVSDEYLAAIGKTQKGYLGNLRQNAINFGLNQNIEAKVKSKTDTTGTEKGEILRLLSINMSTISWDFERAHQAGLNGRWAGITTPDWNYHLTSDLLPGFDFSSGYSLFDGDVTSDTAKFSPVLTSIAASLNIGRGQNPFAVLTRLFGKAVPEAQKAPAPGVDQVRPRTDDTLAAITAAQPVAGSARAGDRFIIPPSQGWRAQFQFSRSSPRAPHGTNVVSFDPRARCKQIANGNTFIEDACIAQLGTQPTNVNPVLTPTAGGTLFAFPVTMSLNSNISFNLTEKWATQWTTTYDMVRHEFASQNMSLQRDLHDWRALFGFTRSPNGNFAFNFTIALKAEPDLKFDYNRATVRNGSF